MNTSLSSPHTLAAPRPWTRLRDELRARRRDRAAHQALVRELAAYRTPAELQDLLAAMDRDERPEADEVRSILGARLAARP